MLSEKYKKVFSLTGLSYLTIFCVGFLLYFKTLFYELVYLDDNVLIVNYHWFFKNLANSKEFFFHPGYISKMFYRPLLNISFMLDTQWGDVLWPYHFTNIGIHVLNGCLLFALLKKLDYAKGLSLSFALIFTVHPVFTQAVAWIPGRTDSLLAVFVLSSFICFLNFLAKEKYVYFLCHLLFFVCALLTKETAIVIPVLCALSLWLIKRTKITSKASWIMLLSWVATTGLWWIARSHVLKASTDLSLLTAVHSLARNLPAIIPYFGKIILPMNLSVLPVLVDMRFTYGYVSLLMVIILFVFSKSPRWHYCLWGGCWFLLFLLPSLVISFLKHEYRLYLPMIGVIILLLETGPVRSLAEHPKRATTVLVIILTVFAIITFQYSDQFKDRFTFWHSAVKTSPHSPLAHRNLGAMYHLNGEIDKAETSYRRSFALDPREPMVQNNLGLIYAKRGLLKQAEDAYKGEIAVNPLYSNVHFNLGILYYNQGEIEQAVELWERTLELDPQYIEAYKYLAVHSFDTGNSQKTSYYVDQLKTRGIPVSKEIIKELEVLNR